MGFYIHHIGIFSFTNYRLIICPGDNLVSETWLDYSLTIGNVELWERVIQVEVLISRTSYGEDFVDLVTQI